MAIQSFLNFLDESKQLDEAFNSAPYELTFGKKNAGDIFFTFVDEDEKEFRIQFYTPQGLGKNVRQVFIGQKRGSTYPDAIGRFKNPMRVIASMIEATKQFMATPLGKPIDGYAVNFSKKALDRGMTLIPKIIRQSGLKQKLNVMDLTYSPVPDRGYVWLVKKGKDPAQVFDGPKMKGITWDDPDKIGDVPDQVAVDVVPQDTSNKDADITEGVKVPSNGKIVTKTKSTFTIRWDMGFPPSGPYAGAVLETTVLRVRENDYVISNIASTKNKTLNDLKSYDYRGDINSLLKEEGERYSLANNQLSTLTSISYNPNKLGYDLVSVGRLGEVRFNGQDIGLPSNRQVVINAVMKMNDQYEKTGGGKKTGVDLATYAGSIRDNAPKGRDLDWQIYASRDGQTLNVDWDITFRRNTTEGAYREFKDQINRANQYLQTVYNDAKAKGYNPTEPNLMTLDSARQSDEWAMSNGDSAYSEYEQSLGGNLQIRLK